MTVNAAASRGVGCGQCGMVNRVGDRFCESCGSTLTYPPGPPPGPPPPWLDDEGVDATTRYLCAAAHLDPRFAREAIGEYLVEEVRAIPPSPGVDAAAVLRDAVAARCRGKIRDGLLLGLVVLSLFTVTGVTVFWIIIAVVAAMAMPAAGQQSRAKALAGLGLAVAAVLLLVWLLPSGYLSLLVYGIRASGGWLLVAFVLALAVFSVLLADEWIVDQLTRNRFRRTAFRADPWTTSGWERVARTLGLPTFGRELARVAAAATHRETDGSAQVVVHRGWVPFVGSGRLVADQTISLPLERAVDHRAPVPFTVVELTTAIREAMNDLRRSASLSPGRRLARLEIHEQVFLPADQLTHLARTPLAQVLIDRHRPPAERVPIGQARALADFPIEAGRYYLCFRIESWDRDVVTSCFLTAATDQRTLYLEWSNTVLQPLKARYRAIDRPPELGPGIRALLAALTLPATLPARIASLCHFYRSIPQGHDEIATDRFGAGHSLRELAAAEASHNFFQDADAIRYVKLIEQALFRSVSQFLEARGYSISEVLDVARTRIAQNNFTITGGTFNNSAIGIGRTQHLTNPPRQPQAQPSPRRP
jgi:hypothetical protein